MLSIKQLQKVFPGGKAAILEAVAGSYDILAEDYQINTDLRLAHFLAQIAHESGGFRLMEENLNYSGPRLLEVFPKYFKNKDINQYARNPRKIANLVYGNRMGNGDEGSGDGYTFRGRGLIQLTGRNNYQAFADAVDMSIEDAVEYLTTPQGAVDSAAWFWSDNGCNQAADQDSVPKVTKIINGGTNGLADRQEYTHKFKNMLGV